MNYPDGIKEEHMSYLNRLRESGVTNMFGATSYIENEFDLPETEAKDALLFWMGHFEEVKDL